MNSMYQFYFYLPGFRKYGLLGKIIDRILLKIFKIIFDLYVPKRLKKTHHAMTFTPLVDVSSNAVKNIVSLTSFPARIDEIWITIETLMKQTLQPDMIILWLANEQFPDRNLPDSLKSLQSMGLLIRYCDDLRSHKKYYYTMLEYPNANVITVDDDVYYPANTLEKLMEFHQLFPNCIIANRAHLLTFTDQKINSYKKWKHNYKRLRVPSHALVPTGVGGVLYPPNALHKDVFDTTAFKELCFHADDLWLKVNAFRNDVKVVATDYFNKDLITVSKSQTEKLVSQNVFDGGNDKQFDRVCHHFSIQASQFIHL